MNKAAVKDAGRFLKERSFEQAIERAQAVLDDGDCNAYAYLIIAFARFGLRQYEAAEAAVRQMLKYDVSAYADSIIYLLKRIGAMWYLHEVVMPSIHEEMKPPG